jgi:hypothetical protein
MTDDLHDLYNHNFEFIAKKENDYREHFQREVLWIFCHRNLLLPHDLLITEVHHVKRVFTNLLEKKPLKNQEAGNNFKKMELVSRSSLMHEREK